MCILSCSLQFSPVCVVIRKTSSPRLPIPVPSRKRHVAMYVCRFALCICTLNRSLNTSSCCICVPLAPSCKYTCQAHFLLSMLSMASSRGKRVPHSTTTALLNSAEARGQHRRNTRLGGWTQINIKEGNRVLFCAS